MINESSFQRVVEPRFSSSFVFPAYQDYCFSRIPGTVLSLFGVPSELPKLPDDVLPANAETGTSPKHVISLFLDAFGWMFVKQFLNEHPFLKHFVRDGVVSQLTSQFPSTTPLHFTTIATGTLLDENRIYGFDYYEPKFGGVIKPLLFSWTGDSARESLLATGIEASEIFPKSTQFQLLASSGITSSLHQSRDFAYSTYSKFISRGAVTVPFDTVFGGIQTLADSVRATKSSHYSVFYVHTIDSTCHRYGPGAEETKREIVDVLDALESQLSAALSHANIPTVICLFADHGQMAVSENKVTRIDEAFPKLRADLLHGGNGKPILFSGSARDLFLHLTEQSLPNWLAQLSDFLNGKAEVFATADLLDRGIFGSISPDSILRAQLGNITILPYQGESVIWSEGGKYEKRSEGKPYAGQHGGLSRDEMEIPFCVLAR